VSFLTKIKTEIETLKCTKQLLVQRVNIMTRLERPLDLDSYAADVLETKSSKFQKFAKNVKIKFRKSVPYFFAYWHIDHVNHVLQESDKNCRSSSDLKKKFDGVQLTDINHLYTMSSADCSSRVWYGIVVFNVPLDTL